MSIRVTNIQRMCFDDGPGIRTTVFLKGCSIHCPWCCNPENLEYEMHLMDGHVCGKDYDSEELFEILIKDRAFWNTGGGVTFSGGEALLQAHQLEPLLKKLKEEKIHIAVETALFVDPSLVEIALQYVDWFYVDVKILDAEQCKTVLGGVVDVYLKNVSILQEHHAEIHFRIPCSREYVMNDSNRQAIGTFLKENENCTIEIFSVHGMGQAKYEKMGQTMEPFETLRWEELEAFQRELQEIGCRHVSILTI